MRWIVLLTALLIAVPLSACINDSDTRRRQKEAKPDDPMRGLPAIPEVLRGRFDQYPAVYYEDRRDRVKAKLEADPSQFELYDDLAVAYDRLGDDATAIVWMDRKLEVLNAESDKSTPEWHEHWYSYYANQGTFYAHQWFHDGADRGDTSGLEKAVDLIAKAIEIKPNAHFGREKYQLMALKWIASEPTLDSAGELPNMLGVSRDEISGLSGSDQLEAKGLSDAVQGISGLIVLGAAWESVDATYALGLALRIRGDADNSYAALLRCKELIDAGKKTMVVGAPTGDRLASMLALALPQPGDSDRAEAIAFKFGIERKAAQEWRETRKAKITEMLAAGRHPDTDPNFWQDLEAVSPPEPMLAKTAEADSDGLLWYGLIVLIALAVGGATLVMVRRNNRPAPPPPTAIGRAQADSYSG